MRSLPSIHSPDVSAATAAVREALTVLERASSDWRNGNAHVPGPVHWTAAIPAAWKALSRALEALEMAGGAPAATATTRCPCGREHCPGDCLGSLDWQERADARDGIATYNSWTRAERMHWHQVARSAVPADAWRAFQAAALQP
jgi:hypothetical protein